MGIKELRSKYGKNLKGRQAVNRAIREEVIGGEDAMDALEKLHRIAERYRIIGIPDAVAVADAAYAECQRLVDYMSDVIAERYELTSDRGDV